MSYLLFTNSDFLRRSTLSHFPLYSSGKFLLVTSFFFAVYATGRMFSLAGGWLPVELGEALSVIK